MTSRPASSNVGFVVTFTAPGWVTKTSIIPVSTDRTASLRVIPHSTSDGKYPLEEELVNSAIVTVELNHFLDSASPGLTFDMDHKIHGFSDLGLDIFEARLLVAAHDQIGESAKGFGRGISMDGGQ
jgi:hypothetical protein